MFVVYVVERSSQPIGKTFRGTTFTEVARQVKGYNISKASLIQRSSIFHKVLPVPCINSTLKEIQKGMYFLDARYTTRAHNFESREQVSKPQPVSTLYSRISPKCFHRQSLELLLCDKYKILLIGN